MNLKNSLAILTGEKFGKKDRIELDRDILSAKFLSEIQFFLDENKITRKNFANKVGVSQSFISQLFTGEKVVSMEFLAKTQQAYKIKFNIRLEETLDYSSKSDSEFKQVYLDMNIIDKQNNWKQNDVSFLSLLKGDNIYDDMDQDIDKIAKLQIA